MIELIKKIKIKKYSHKKFFEFKKPKREMKIAIKYGVL
jgi:hypothetical protein